MGAVVEVDPVVGGCVEDGDTDDDDAEDDDVVAVSSPLEQAPPSNASVIAPHIIRRNLVRSERSV
jgi:hypothetical protein